MKNNERKGDLRERLGQNCVVSAPVSLSGSVSSNAYVAALASAVAFSVGASVPLLGAAFLKDYKRRLGVMLGVVSLALIILGGLIGVLGKAPWMKSSFRSLIAGWLGIAATFGLAKLAHHLAMD